MSDAQSNTKGADSSKPADSSAAGGATDKKDETKQENLLPLGEITAVPQDHKVYDQQMVDQILHVCGLDDLSPLKDSPHHYNIKIEWWDLGEKEGVKMDYAQLPGSANYVFRGVGVVPAAPKLLEDAIRVPENMKLIDPMCKDTKTIKTYDRDHHVYWASFKLPPLISDRDFVWWSLDINLPDGTFITTGKSIATKDCEKTSWHVRGEIRASGYVVQPVKDDPNSSKVTYVVQTDPRGWLPTKVVNYVARSQAFNPGVMKEKVAEFKEQLEAKAKALAQQGGDQKDQQQSKGQESTPAAAGAAGAQQSQGQEPEKPKDKSQEQQQAAGAPQNPAPAQDAPKSGA